MGPRRPHLRGTRGNGARNPSCRVGSEERRNKALPAVLYARKGAGARGGAAVRARVAEASVPVVAAEGHGRQEPPPHPLSRSPSRAARWGCFPGAHNTQEPPQRHLRWSRRQCQPRPCPTPSASSSSGRTFFACVNRVTVPAISSDMKFLGWFRPPEGPQGHGKSTPCSVPSAAIVYHLGLILPPSSIPFTRCHALLLHPRSA